MKRLSLLLAVCSLAACGDLTTPHSGYNVVVETDSTLLPTPFDRALCSGYNVITGRCGDSSITVHLGVAADTTCPFGYIIAYGQCEPAASAATATSSSHVKVAIPAETGWVIAADQRFVPIRPFGASCTGPCGVVDGVLVYVNAITRPDYVGPDPFGQRALIATPAGMNVDIMSGQIVAQSVVDEWFYAWNTVATAHPDFTPRLIQLAIGAGNY